jgi:hypothetical protein
MKVAVIAIGIFKYDELTLNQVKRCYNLDNNNVDLFIYNNNTFDDNEKLRTYCSENKINLICLKSQKYSKNTVKKKRQWVINDKIKNNWNKFKQQCINENIVNNEKLSIHVPFKNMSFFRPRIDCHYQYEQTYLALQEIINYENINKFSYDYIMKIRLDFYLNYDRFGPIHYFNDKNDVLLKSYNNLKYYYDKITEEDSYHELEKKVNNYLYWRATKFLGGKDLLNKKSYDEVKNFLHDREKFNSIISDKFVITINDFCFFSSGNNFKKFMNNLYYNYGEHYDEKSKWWWTPEVQFLLSIRNSNLFYFDYLQNSNSFKGVEIWVNDYHGTEKYDKGKMRT